MTKEEQKKFHQHVRGKILKAVDVNVFQRDHKRLYQEGLGQYVVAQDSEVRKAEEEQEEEILGNHMKVNVNNKA